MIGFLVCAVLAELSMISLGGRSIKELNEAYKKKEQGIDEATICLVVLLSLAYLIGSVILAVQGRWQFIVIMAMAILKMLTKQQENHTVNQIDSTISIALLISVGMGL